MQWYDRALNCQKIIRNDAKSDGRSQWYSCYKIRCQFGTAGPWHAFQNSIVPVTSLRRICCGRLLFPLNVVGFAQNICIFRRLDNNRRMLDVVCTSWSGHIILTAQEAWWHPRNNVYSGLWFDISLLFDDFHGWNEVPNDQSNPRNTLRSITDPSLLVKRTNWRRVLFAYADFRASRTGPCWAPTGHRSGGVRDMCWPLLMWLRLNFPEAAPGLFRALPDTNSTLSAG